MEVIPSKSFEIKQTEHGYKTVINGEENQHGYHNIQNHVHQEEPIPVIVLRIPGPQKYASHLQALLQQYLEVRAAQYIQLLQEQEARGHSIEHQQLQYNAHPEDSYQPIQYQQHYAQPVVQQEYGPPQQIEYANTHDYQPQQLEQEQIPQEEEPEEPSHSLAVPPEADPHSQLGYQTDGAPETQYQDDFRPSQLDHSQHEEAHIPHQPSVDYGPPSQHEEESHHDPSSLLTTENFPSDKHTQVIFKSTTEQPYIYHSSHAPAVQVQTIRAPLVYHKLEEFYDQNRQINSELEYGSHSDIGSIPTETNYVTITPRPSGPYNYHAHQSESYEHDYSPAASSINSRSSKRQAQIQEEQYKKFTTLMHRLKQRMTSTKTTASSSATA